jgi:hypothetical protein
MNNDNLDPKTQEEIVGAALNIVGERAPQKRQRSRRVLILTGLVCVLAITASLTWLITRSSDEALSGDTMQPVSIAGDFALGNDAPAELPQNWVLAQNESTVRSFNTTDDMCFVRLDNQTFIDSVDYINDSTAAANALQLQTLASKGAVVTEVEKSEASILINGELTPITTQSYDVVVLDEKRTHTYAYLTGESSYVMLESICKAPRTTQDTLDSLNTFTASNLLNINTL